MKLTEGQSKDLVYFERATGSSPMLDQYETALTDPGQRVRDAIPLVGNALTNPDFQRGNQAGREWLSAILRKDTGAAITKQEFDIYGPMYLPQFGDSPEVLAQKREGRKRAEDAIRRGLGTAEVLAAEMLAQREEAKAVQPVAPPATPAGSDLPSIADQAGYDALPAGATYRAPDGSLRRKR